MARVTINMIAEKAGVSRGTVDRVLHNRAEVSAEVREQVLAVAKILDYPMPGQARGIRKSDKAEINERRLIGVILPGNHWFDDNLKREWMRGLADARAIVESLGYRVELVECETDIPGDIIEAAQALLSRGPAGIALTGMNTELMRNYIDCLAEDGIPVVTFNSDLPESRRTCFIGQDPYRSGRVAANLLFRQSGWNGQVLVIAGNMGYAAHNSRVRGFVDVCREQEIPEEQILVKESHNEYFLTYEIVKAALREYPELRMVYMANESVAACADALGDERKNRGIMVVGNDLTNTTKKLLLEGRIDFIIEQNIYWQGYQPVVTLKKLIEMPGFPVPENAFTDVSIVNAESIR